jgi:cobalamin biosynthesis protein CbiD
MNSIQILRLIFLSLFPLCFFACGSSNDDHGHHHGHHHDPMFGGVLIELGDHAHNLELVHDKETGTLDAYILGGHASKVVKIAQESIVVNLDLPSGETEVVELKAVADEITKEIVGNTSHFSATQERLKTSSALKGKVEKIEAQGATYTQISFDLNEKHDHKH